MTATARPYVTESDDNPLFAPDLINNHEIPATMQTITLKNYSIDEIMEGKQGHTTIKTSCKYQENQHAGHVLYSNQSDMCTHYWVEDLFMIIELHNVKINTIVKHAK